MPDIPLKNVEDVYTLSPVQEGILYHALSAPNSGVYIEQFTCRLIGTLEPGVFESGWECVFDRHPSLRAIYLWEEIDEPLQIVRQKVSFPWRHEDWRDASAEEQNTRLRDYLRRDRQEGFDLSRSPVTRMLLVREHENQWRFVWSFHHVTLDGWSTRLIFREALAAYRDLLGSNSGIHSEPKPFREYIGWLRRQDGVAAREFWEAELSGFTEPSRLLIHNEERAEPGTHARIERSLGRSQTQELRRMVQKHRLTLNTAIHGAWAWLLHRYSGQSDVVFGTTVAGRPHTLPGVEEMIGCFINTLPLRTAIDPDAKVVDFLSSLQQRHIAIRTYEYTSLNSIQSWSGIAHGASLLDSIVVFENFPTSGFEPELIPDLTVEDLDIHEQSNFPLALLVVPEDESLRIIFIVDTSRYPSSSIERIGDQFALLLQWFCENPEAEIGAAPLGTADGISPLTRWSEGPLLPDVPPTILEDMNYQAAHSSDEPAVIYREEVLTYGQLELRADALAAALRSRGIVRGDLVALCIERSIEMVVGIWGILKAGAAYVPLDPAYPKARLAFMLSDSNAAVLVTRSNMVPDITGVPRLHMEDVGSGTDDGGAPSAQPADLAYVIYTSGSTGQPKGVGVTHENLAHSTRARRAYYDEPVSRFLLLSSFSFDSSVAGIFWTLGTGGTLILPQDKQEQDISALSDLIHDRKVSHMLCLPSLYRLILEYAPPDRLKSLRIAITAGEACSPLICRQHHALLPGCELHNEYGPTEATVWCTAWRSDPDVHSGQVPIGRPIPGARIQVLDSLRRHVPPGAIGEIYIGGAGVVPGYLHRADLTAERFLTLPGLPRERWYRSGDLGCWSASGALLFLGRVDEQAKVRGYRIELGEVQSSLNSHPGVSESIALVLDPSEDAGGDNADGTSLPHEAARADRRSPAAAKPARLVAYVALVSGKTRPEPDELKCHLQEQLPSHAIPSDIVLLDAIPRLPNGKADLNALPRPGASQSVSDGDGGRHTQTEETLLSIWRELLGIDTILTDDDFFEIGGDSILSIQMVSMARAGGVRIAPHDLADYPTIAGLASAAETTGEAIVVAEDAVEREPFPLTPIQCWFFGLNMDRPEVWNQALSVEIDSAVDSALIEKAVEEVLRHHDQLRAGFRQEGGEWIQEVGDELCPLREIHLAGPVSDHRYHPFAEAAHQLQEELRLDGRPLIRFGIAWCGETRRLVILAHHLIIDPYSWEILVKDLDSALQDVIKGREIRLPDKSHSFAYRARQIAPTHDGDAGGEVEYWAASETAVPGRIPRDRICDQELVEADSESVSVELDGSSTSLLFNSVSTAYNTKVEDLLLAAFARLLVDWTGKRTFRIGVERHGRDVADRATDSSRTIGWFTTFFPLRLSLIAGGSEFGQDIGTVKDALRGVPRSGIGYGQLRYAGDPNLGRRVGLDEEAEDVLFNYMGTVPGSGARSGPVRAVEPMFFAGRAPTNRRSHLLEINSRHEDENLKMEWIFNRAAHDRLMIERWSRAYITELERVIEHCASREEAGFTPSDFPEAEMSQQELDSFLDQL